MLSELYYFNGIALSDTNIPLPVSQEEKMIFYARNTYFSFKSKQTKERVESPSGCFFLTTMRLIYVPDATNIFVSFFVPLSRLFAVENNDYLECLCENSYIGVITLNFKSWQNDFFFGELRKAVESTAMDVDEDIINDDMSIIPYYSDLSE